MTIAEPCRLCGGVTSARFEATLLGRHVVRYACCNRCGSLQTQAPHWLEEAYRDGGLSSLDTGAAQRNVQNLAAGLAVARLFNLHTATDFGGGNGLLCRMLRDRGLDTRVIDLHAHCTYARGYVGSSQDRPDLLMAFEVLEHFAEPRAELAGLFAFGPQVLLVSTDLYEGQGPDWPYLSTDTGQHVFFYSRKALQQAPDEHEYSLTHAGGYSLFVRKGCCARWKLALARQLLKAKRRRWLQAWAVTRSTAGTQRDHAEQLMRTRTSRHL